MIPLLATLTAVVDVTFDVLQAGSHAIDRFKALRAARAPSPVEGALSYLDVERQRAQAQAGASHGTVSGPKR